MSLVTSVKELPSLEISVSACLTQLDLRLQQHLGAFSLGQQTWQGMYWLGLSLPFSWLMWGESSNSCSHHGTSRRCGYLLPSKIVTLFEGMVYSRWILRLGNGCVSMHLGYIRLLRWTNPSHLMSMDFWLLLLEKHTSWGLVILLQYPQRQAWGWPNSMRYLGHCLRNTCFSFQTVSL